MGLTVKGFGGVLESPGVIEFFSHGDEVFGVLLDWGINIDILLFGVLLGVDFPETMKQGC